MLKSLFAAMTVILLSSTGPKSQNVDGNHLLSACSEDNLATQGYCIGYIIGVIEGTRYGIAYPMMLGGEEDMGEVNTMSNNLLMNCPPDNIQYGQYIDIAKNYLKDNPQERHYPARGLVLHSLQQAFPCQ